MKRRGKDHNEAVKLRLKGWSYSQIKVKLSVSKSTLSGWLAKYPLSNERIRQLRGSNPQRIEKCRNTKAEKKRIRVSGVYDRVRKDIGVLNKREIFLAGLFLYWGEGYKSAPATTGIANTDPAILRIFIAWLKVVEAPIEKIVVRIHIYSDMDRDATIKYWKDELGLPRSCFGQIYTKKSRLTGLSYKNGFGHGTCNILIYNRDLSEYIMSGLRYLREELSKVTLLG